MYRGNVDSGNRWNQIELSLVLIFERFVHSFFILFGLVLHRRPFIEAQTLDQVFDNEKRYLKYTTTY